MTRPIRRIMVPCLALLVFCSFAFAAGPAITIVPTGTNAYTVQGSAMDNVAGIDLVIAYDPAAHTAPVTVTQGSLIAGALFAANTTKPGQIRVAIITTKTFAGSGPVAQFSFASGSSTAAVPTATASFIDSQGAVMSPSGSNPTLANSSAVMTTPGIPFSQPSTTTAASSVTSSLSSSGVTAAPATYPGTISMPMDPQKQPHEPSVPVTADQSIAHPVEHVDSNPVDQAPPPAQALPTGKTEATAQYLVHKGILERFKQYRGEKTLAKLTALFKKEISDNIHQDPSPVLSDGKTPVKLTIDLPARITSAPNFALNGASMVSYKQDPGVKGRWILTALPAAMTMEATLTALTEAEGIEYPLAVAPPLRTTLKPDQAGWELFVKNSGTREAPLYDLNQDGVRDYRDDYIFVANFLSHKFPAPLPEALKTPKK